MGKRKGDQPNSETPAPGNEADKLAAQPDPVVPASEAMAKIESPDLVPSQAAQPAPPVEAASAPPVAPPELAVAEASPVFVELASAHPTSVEPPIARLDDVRPGATMSAAATGSVNWARARRLTPLAATIAIAAAVGAMAGSLATAGLGHLFTAAPQVADAGSLRDGVARLNTDLAALKAAVDTSGRAATAQLTKLGDRFDRFERAQAEPTARLAKLAEAVDRIEHHAAAAAPAATSTHDITGSVATTAPSPQLAAAEPVRPAGPPALDGWTVRGVYNGAALIQGRLGGVVEVMPGDNLPGLGRIENIKRQDGRWVVVTSKGVIFAR
jgi:hypothetical protein